MVSPDPIQATVLRAPSPDAVCDCTHSVNCVCACHDLHCDPSEELCHVDFRPDDGGLTFWGCARCTPGQESPHFLGCELIGWNVPVPMARMVGRSGGGGIPAFG